MVNRQLTGGLQHPEGDGQIIDRAFLAEIAGCEIDGGPGARHMEALLLRAEETRSSDSFTAASGRPTRMRSGAPASPVLTSTSTGSASMPCRAAEWMVASMTGKLLKNENYIQSATQAREIPRAGCRTLRPPEKRRELGRSVSPERPG